MKQTQRSMKRSQRASRNAKKSTHSVLYADDFDDSDELSTEYANSVEGEAINSVAKGHGNSGDRRRSGWRHTERFEEDHKQNLFSIQFNPHTTDQLVFATAGANRLCIYECILPQGIKLLRMYADPTETECFYSCAWSHTGDTPLVAFAGKQGVIRIIYPTTLNYSSDELSYTGHGQAVNHLAFNPIQPSILMSASKDHDIRLWNIKTHCCVAILGGVEGHMDEVLFAEFSMDGNRIVSCGMDHYLKIWNLDGVKIKDAVKRSEAYDRQKSKRAFYYHRDHFPVFSTRDIHKNYVDCALDFGKFIISKSCENEIVIWMPDKKQAKGVTIVSRLPVRDCDIWFMRISMDREKKQMALGDQVGNIHIWDLDVSDPKHIKSVKLKHPNSNVCIRQTAFSPTCKTLLACCDDGTVWRWDKH